MGRRRKKEATSQLEHAEFLEEAPETRLQSLETHLRGTLGSDLPRLLLPAPSVGIPRRDQPIGKRNGPGTEGGQRSRPELRGRQRGRPPDKAKQNKTDQRNQACTRNQFRSDSDVRVVRALQEYEAQAPEKKISGAGVSEPLFTFDNGKPISREDIGALLKLAVVAEG